MGRISSAKASGTNSSVLSKLSYAYDQNSNPISVTVKDGNQGTFSYDALDHLTAGAYPDKTLSYARDAGRPPVGVGLR